MADWLAQLGKHWSAEWEMTGNQGRINAQGSLILKLKRKCPPRFE